MMPDVCFHFADLLLKTCDLGHQLLPHLDDDDDNDVDDDEDNNDNDDDEDNNDNDDDEDNNDNGDDEDNSDKDDDEINSDEDNYDEDAHPSHRLLLHLLNLIQVGFSWQLQKLHKY